MTVTRADFVVRQGDTLPRFSATVTDADGARVNLSGASVRLHLHGMTVTKDVDGAAHVADSQQGEVYYDWSPDDTTEAGYFAAEFEVHFANGEVQTFPNEGHFVVQVTEQLQ